DILPTIIYTLSLHDALPIFVKKVDDHRGVGDGQEADRFFATIEVLAPGIERRSDHRARFPMDALFVAARHPDLRLAFAAEDVDRSEEHTSELQSRGHLVCRL